jgi:hypothetical protein
MRAATVISLMSLLKILPRLASVAPFLCFMEDHLLCPDISSSYPFRKVERFETRYFQKNAVLFFSESNNINFLADLSGALGFKNLVPVKNSFDRI